MEVRQMDGTVIERPPQDVPPTEKQLRYAKRLAERGHVVLPWSVQQSRRSLSQWIHANNQTPAGSVPDADRPTSRQVAFAERIARRKRLAVPDECFQSRELMSRWIDSHR